MWIHLLALVLCVTADTNFTIVFLMPLFDGNMSHVYFQKDSRAALYHALNTVNKDSTLLPGVNLVASEHHTNIMDGVYYDEVRDEIAVTRMLNVLEEENLLGVVGPLFSTVTYECALIASSKRILMVTPTAASPLLQDKAAIPYLFRMISSPYTYMAMALMSQYNWTRIAVMADVFGETIYQHFKSKVAADVYVYGIMHNEAFISQILNNIMTAGVRIIFVFCLPSYIEPLREAAMKYDMIGNGHTWIFLDDRLQGFSWPGALETNYRIETTPHIPGWETLVNISEHAESGDGVPNGYAWHVYEAVITLCRAAHNVLASGNDPRNGILLREAMRNYEHHGTNGSVMFDIDQDLASAVYVKNRLADGVATRTVGRLDSSREYLELEAVYWGFPLPAGQSAPTDGSGADPRKCVVMLHSPGTVSPGEAIRISVQVFNSFQEEICDSAPLACLVEHHRTCTPTDAAVRQDTDNCTFMLLFRAPEKEGLYIVNITLLSGSIDAPFSIHTVRADPPASSTTVNDRTPVWGLAIMLLAIVATAASMIYCLLERHKRNDAEQQARRTQVISIAMRAQLGQVIDELNELVTTGAVLRAHKNLMSADVCAKEDAQEELALFKQKANRLQSDEHPFGDDERVANIRVATSALNVMDMWSHRLSSMGNRSERVPSSPAKELPAAMVCGDVDDSVQDTLSEQLEGTGVEFSVVATDSEYEVASLTSKDVICVLYVVSGNERNIVHMLTASGLILYGVVTLLVVQFIPRGITFPGDVAAAADDEVEALNRARRHLADHARRRGVHVFPNVMEGSRKIRSIFHRTSRVRWSDQDSHNSTTINNDKERKAASEEEMEVGTDGTRQGKTSLHNAAARSHQPPVSAGQDDRFRAPRDRPAKLPPVAGPSTPLTDIPKPLCKPPG